MTRRRARAPAEDGKRLERREETAGAGAGAAELAAAADSGGDGRSSRDGERVSQSRGDRGAAAGEMGPAPAKSGQRGVYRPWCKTGQRGVHRPWSKTGQRGVHRLELAAASWACAVGERVRAVSRGHRAGRRRGRNAKAIWQDLVDDQGFAAAVCEREAVCTRSARGAVARGASDHHHGAGRGGQVDYGQGPMVRDAQTGKYRRTRLFVLTLGHSRKSVRLLSFRSSSRDLGRAARAGISPAGRRAAGRGAG